MATMIDGLRRMVSRLTGSSDPNESTTYMYPGIYYPTSLAGVPVDEHRALTYSVVFACVRIISDTLMTLPFYVHSRRDGRGADRLPEHPVSGIIHRVANDEMDAGAWRSTTMAHALTWGNGYSEIERTRSGDPVNVWPIEPDRVTPRRSDQTGRLEYEISNGSESPTMLPASEVFHLRGLGFNGLVGYSPIALAREGISMGMAAEQFGSSFFGNGARPGGVVGVGGNPGKKQLEQAREEFQNIYGGPRNAGRWAFVPLSQLEVKPLTIPPQDAQYIETRKYQVVDIAPRWFGVPCHKVGDMDGAKFNNVEQMAIQFVQDCLLPWAARMEREANLKLLGRDESRLYTKMNLQGLLRGDAKTRALFYKTMFGMGAMSPNEIRDFEEMNPYDDGDLYLVPMNMVPADQADQLASMKAAPNPQTNAPPGDGDPDAIARSMHAVARHEMEWVTVKESHAMARVASGDHAAFDAWADRFYEGFANDVRRVVEPVMASMQVMASAIGMKTSAIDAASTTSSIADRMSELAAARARDEFHQSGSLERLTVSVDECVNERTKMVVDLLIAALLGASHDESDSRD